MFFLRSLFLVCLICSISARLAAEPMYRVISNSELLLAKQAVKTIANDRKRLDRLFEICYYYLYKPKLNRQDFDSAALYISKARKIAVHRGFRPDYLSFKILSASLNCNLGRYETGIRYLNETIVEASQKKFHRQHAEALYNLAWMYPEQRLERYSKAAELFRMADCPIQQAYMYVTIGVMYNRMGGGKNELVQELASKALSLYTRHNYPNTQYVYNLLSNVKQSANDFPGRVKYILQAIEASRNSRDTLYIGYHYHELGHSYKEMGERNNALYYYKKAYSAFVREGDMIWIYYSSAQIAELLQDLDQAERGELFYRACIKNFPTRDSTIRLMQAQFFSAYYVKAGKLILAGLHCGEMLKLEIGIAREPRHRITTYATAAKYFIEVRDFERARAYLDLAGISNVTENLPVKRALEYHYFKVDSLTGRYLGAIRHFQNYKRLSDSILDENKTNRIKDLEIYYKVKEKESALELKDQNIAILDQKTLLLRQEAVLQENVKKMQLLKLSQAEILAKKNDSLIRLNRKNISSLNQNVNLQHHQLKQAALIKNIVFVVVFLLITIIVLLYSKYRQNSRSNRITSDQNLLLQQLLNEKGWLLREVHHRVKNNLQTVTALLESQAAYLKDEALEAIENSQHRIQVMSLIHQKLYQSENVRTVYMRTYFEQFISYLAESFDTGQSIIFKQNIGDIELNATQAIPLALIVNEAVTNAIKHAFPNGKRGEVSISLCHERERVHLLVSDSGIGISAEDIKNTSGSLGLSLIKGLAQDLGSDVRIFVNGGTVISLQFVINDFQEPDFSTIY